MDEQKFKNRTKSFALGIIKLVGSLPADRSADVIGRQLIRSGVSVGANYRAACRGRSPADMIAKLKIVEEEGDESIYWLELLQEAGLVGSAAVVNHIREANEIVAMTVMSIKTLRSRISNGR